MTALKNDACALLIGVDDYSAYDPAQNLKGSVNDVAAWQRVCNALGVSPKNVHILGSRTFVDGAVKNKRWPNRFGDRVKVKEATRKNILAEVKWLAKKLASGTVPGLLTYAGHGDVTDDGQLALCPLDVKKGKTGIKNLVTLQELSDLLSAGKAKDLLTVVFDCCHAAGAARPASLSLSLRGASTPEAKGERPRLGAREVYSCGASQVAYQSEFTSQFHGAFTWALTASLLQWRPVEEDGAVRIDVSYEEARSTCQKLLGVLNYENQTAEVYPPSVGEMPFFHPKAEADGGEVKKKPDGERDRIQITPDYFYNITLEDDTELLLAQVVVTGDNPVSLIDSAGNRVYSCSSPKTEYWFVNDAALDSLSSGSKSGIKIARAGFDHDDTTKVYSVTQGSGVASSPTFTPSATSFSWTPGNGTPTTGDSYIYKSPALSAFDDPPPTGTTAVYVLFNLSQSTSGAFTLSEVLWYLDGVSSVTEPFSPSASDKYSPSELPESANMVWAKSA
ncbi:MAG: caspase family protein [Byssovorax sp.]